MRTINRRIGVITNIILFVVIIAVFAVGFIPDKIVAIYGGNGINAIYHGNIENKNVSLMFNVYENTEVVDGILTELSIHDVKATFFVCRTSQPDLIKEIHDRGHTIGIHSVTHDYRQIYSSEEAFFEDVYAMQDYIYECTGVKTTLLRFPGGSSNTVSNFNPGIMTRLAKLVEEKGFQYFDWNASTGDSMTDDIDEMLENAKRYVDNWPQIVLLHHPENEKSS